MLTHDTIWQALDKLAQSRGYSPSGLAKKAGLDPTTFNKSKRRSADGKPRWPSTESLAKVLDVTGASLSEFVGLTDSESPGLDVPPSALAPGAPVAIGLKNGKTMTGTLLRQSAGSVTIAPTGDPSGQQDVKSAHIAWIARIVQTNAGPA